MIRWGTSLLCGLLISCSPSFRVRTMTEEEIRLLPNHENRLANEVAALINKRAHDIRDLQGLLLVSLKTPKHSGIFNGAIVIQWPHSMRLKGFRGSGTTFLDLLIQKSGATLHLPNEGKAYKTDADQFISLGKEATTITARQFLATMTPLPEFSEKLIPQDDSWILKSKTSQYIYDKKTLFLRQALNYDEQGLPILTTSYDEYRLSNGIWFPWLIHIKDAEGSFSTRMLFQDPEVNQGLVPHAFEMTLPDEIEIITP